jgi:antitoxin (DNA-binding transcriptional repressor) of toxin-antitoxin stability system
MQRVELDNVQGQISDLIEIALQGEEIVITQADQPILKLVRIEPDVTQRKRGSAKGMVHIAEDFDAPLNDF